jgi:putative tryptophan/tyrosine transport system substrate-binding protein
MRSILVAVVVLASGVIAAAQQAKVPIIGRLGASSASAEAASINAFRQGLREVGYVEGKNISIEYRHAEGKLERLPTLAAELVKLNVNVIVTGGGNATGAVKAATSTIPIVMAQSGDPVADGLVTSLARPGGNITGLSNVAPELNGKRLELLKEVVPKLTRVAVFGTSTARRNAQALREVELAASGFGIKLDYNDVLDPDRKIFERAFQSASKSRSEALLVTIWGPVLKPRLNDFVALTAKYRLPAMFIDREYVEGGGLMTYGVSEADLHRRAAVYVDKILKGRTPADLPIEQPMKFDFVVNLKAAQQIGLTIPPNVLVRATKVIK